MWAKPKNIGSTAHKFHFWKDGKPLCGMSGRQPSSRQRQNQPVRSCYFCAKLYSGESWREVHGMKRKTYHRGPNVITLVRQRFSQ